MKRRQREEAPLIGVLVVARSVVMRAGLEALIATDSALEIVGSTAYFDLSSQIEQQRPDVVLWEWSAQEEESFPILLTANGFQPAIVLLIDDLSESAIAEFLRAGVRAILPSEASADEIMGAIVAAASGLTVLHSDITEVLLPTLPSPLPEMPSQPLTPREIEVLGMLAEGLSNKTIARRLILSEHTIKFHISSLFNKLNVSSRTEAVILGARQGLIML
ncbi:response regulator transcription factor [Phormidesmis priestleyi]